MDRLLGFFWLRFTLAKPHLSNPTKTKTPFVGANLAIRLSRLSCIYKHHDSWEGEGGGFSTLLTTAFYIWVLGMAYKYGACLYDQEEQKRELEWEMEMCFFDFLSTLLLRVRACPACCYFFQLLFDAI